MKQEPNPFERWCSQRRPRRQCFPTQRRRRRSSKAVLGPLSDAADWTEAQIRERLQELRPLLGYAAARCSAKMLWQNFEALNQHRLRLVLRVAEELLNRSASIDEFFLSHKESGSENLQAILHYLDFRRLRQKEQEEKRSQKFSRPGNVAILKRGLKLLRIFLRALSQLLIGGPAPARPDPQNDV
jgi:hypothetical protein